MSQNKTAVTAMSRKRKSAQIEVEFSAINFCCCSPRVVVIVAVLAGLAICATIQQFVVHVGEGFLRRFSSQADIPVNDETKILPTVIIDTSIPGLVLEKLLTCAYISTKHYFKYTMTRVYLTPEEKWKSDNVRLRAGRAGKIVLAISGHDYFLADPGKENLNPVNKRYMAWKLPDENHRLICYLIKYDNLREEIKNVLPENQSWSEKGKVKAEI